MGKWTIGKMHERHDSAATRIAASIGVSFSIMPNSVIKDVFSFFNL